MDKDANYDELKKGNTVKIAGVLDDYSDKLKIGHRIQLHH